MSTSTDLFTLSKAFLKAGYAATSTVENAMQVMDIVDVRNEDAIARVLAVMVRTHSDLEPSADGQRTWQVDNFVEAIRQQVSKVRGEVGNMTWIMMIDTCM